MMRHEHQQTKGMKHTDGSKLIRWLGSEQTENLSRSMGDFYYPVAVSGVPGNVWAMPGGDFVGRIRAGEEMSARDRLEQTFARLRRGYRRSVRSRTQLQTGFASLSDLIYEVTTNAKRQELAFAKNGASGTTAASSSLFRLGAHPAAGSAASAAPGGSVPTVATTGALIFTNTGNSDTLHITTGQVVASIASTLLLYDRLFAVAKTASSTVAEAVTGSPTRYTSSNAANADYAGGNFCFPEIGTSALGATNHNWTVCKYTPQDGGSPDSIFPSSVGVNTGQANRLDLPVGTWFFPLQAGDIGVKSLTQMQNSASVTGALDFVIGHPLAFLPCPLASLICTMDGINSTFNLVRVYDNACLALLEIVRGSGSATNYAGSITLCAG